MTSPLRVVLVDDHPVVRNGLRALLEASADLEFAGEAGDGEAAVEMVTLERPDVVVMDLHLPGLGGIEATRQIVQRYPNTSVLILSMLDDDASVLEAMRAGARGYVVKGAEPGDVLRAISSVAHGDAVFGPSVAALVLSELSSPRVASPDAFPTLTDRESEVLDLLAQGLRNPDIAQRLGVRPKTVRNHVSNVFTKLAVTDRTEAILRARDAGLG